MDALDFHNLYCNPFLFSFRDLYIYTTSIYSTCTSKMASSDSHHHRPGHHHHGTPTIFYGPVINPVSLTFFSTLPHCLLSVDSSGKIEWMIDNVYEHELEETLTLKKCGHVKKIHLKDGEFLMPGFIDTHTVTHCFSDCATFDLIILWYT